MCLTTRHNFSVNSRSVVIEFVFRIANFDCLIFLIRYPLVKKQGFPPSFLGHDQWFVLSEEKQTPEWRTSLSSIIGYISSWVWMICSYLCEVCSWFDSDKVEIACWGEMCLGELVTTTHFQLSFSTRLLLSICNPKAIFLCITKLSVFWKPTYFFDYNLECIFLSI